MYYVKDAGQYGLKKHTPGIGISHYVKNAGGVQWLSGDRNENRDRINKGEIMVEETKEIIHWCVHCGHLGANCEDQGRRCIKCLRSALENEGVELTQPIYYSP